MRDQHHMVTVHVPPGRTLKDLLSDLTGLMDSGSLPLRSVSGRAGVLVDADLAYRYLANRRPRQPDRASKPVPPPSQPDVEEDTVPHPHVAYDCMQDQDAVRPSTAPASPDPGESDVTPRRGPGRPRKNSSDTSTPRPAGRPRRATSGNEPSTVPLRAPDTASEV